MLTNIFWNEEFNYYSDKSPDTLRDDIRSMLDNRGWDDSINLSGKFISDYEFKITPKRQFVTIRNYERETAFLKGKIFKDEKGKTSVTVRVRPNSVFAILFIIFPIGGIINLLTYRPGQSQYGAILFGLVFSIVVPLIVIALAKYAKKGITSTFISTFRLKRIKRYNP